MLDSALAAILGFIVGFMLFVIMLSLADIWMVFPYGHWIVGGFAVLLTCWFIVLVDVIRR